MPELPEVVGAGRVAVGRVSPERELPLGASLPIVLLFRGQAQHVAVDVGVQPEPGTDDVFDLDFQRAGGQTAAHVQVAAALPQHLDVLDDVLVWRSALEQPAQQRAL